MFDKLKKEKEDLENSIKKLSKEKENLENEQVQLQENKKNIENEIYELNKKSVELNKNIEKLDKQLKSREEFYVETELKYIDSLDGFSFEKYCEILLNNLEYEATVTQCTNDGGADVIAVKEGKKYAVQCKNYTDNVEYKAVQEVIAAKQLYDCDEAIVVTNSFFTNQAIERAIKLNVELWDRNYLKKLLYISYDFELKHIDTEKNYNNFDNKISDRELFKDNYDDITDPLLNDVIEYVIEIGQASTSLVQRRFKIGYARAGRIIDQMEERGIISGYEGSKPRMVFMTKERWQEINNEKD